MAIGKDLILDVGGVLASNFSPLFWERLSAESAVPYDRLFRFKKDVREELWAGILTVEDFWARLCGLSPSIDRRRAESLLAAAIVPLPAFFYAEKWSRLADIHILSNHRMEWIEPVLKPIAKHVSSVTSSQLGCCKPGPEIYAWVQKKLSSSGNVLFVDDQDKNFKEAKALGWATLLADADGSWLDKVELFLAAESPNPM